MDTSEDLPGPPDTHWDKSQTAEALKNQSVKCAVKKSGNSLFGSDDELFGFNDPKKPEPSKIPRPPAPLPVKNSLGSSEEESSEEAIFPNLPILDLIKNLQILENKHKENSRFIESLLFKASFSVAKPPQHRETNLEILATAQKTHTHLQQIGTLVHPLVEKTNVLLDQLKEIFSQTASLEASMQSLADILEIQSQSSMAMVGLSHVPEILVLPMSTAPGLFKNLKFDPSETEYGGSSIRRTQISDSVFFVDQAVPMITCNKLQKEAQYLGYQDTPSPVDPRYRSNPFVLTKCKPFADYLWSRIENMFGRKDMVVTKDGVWTPKKISECFKFTKYLSGTPILEPLDGPWIPTQNQVSLPPHYLHHILVCCGFFLSSPFHVSCHQAILPQLVFLLPPKHNKFLFFELCDFFCLLLVCPTSCLFFGVVSFCTNTKGFFRFDRTKLTFFLFRPPSLVS